MPIDFNLSLDDTGPFAAVPTATPAPVELEAIKFRVYDTLVQKYYMDWLYENAFVRPYFAVAALLARFDSTVIDGVVNGVAALWRRGSDAAYRFDRDAIDFGMRLQRR